MVGGIGVENAKPGEYMVRYQSGEDRLRKTPAFYQQVTRDRLNSKLNHAYRYAEVLYGGRNPYIEAIRANITHLVKILETNDWTLLRREPQFFLGIAHAVQDIERLVASQLASLAGVRLKNDGPLLMPV